MEWCAKTHLHKCNGGDAAFILQRSVHRRANTLSRHKYLVGEQISSGSLNPRGERRSAGRRLRVYTSRRSMVFNDLISWLSRGRWTNGRGDGRGTGVRLSHFQIMHSRYSHLHGRRGTLICLTLPHVRVSSRVCRCQLRWANHIGHLVTKERIRANINKAYSRLEFN